MKLLHSFRTLVFNHQFPFSLTPCPSLCHHSFVDPYKVRVHNCTYTYIKMRIRNRKGSLVLSSYMQQHTVSKSASDPQLNQPTTPHQLHPIPTNHVEQKPITHSQPSDSSHQPPFLLPSHHPPKTLRCKLTNSSHTSATNQMVRYQYTRLRSCVR